MDSGDSQILATLKTNPKHSLKLLYQKYFESIYRFFYYQTNFHTPSAQDLTQDTFIQVAKSLKKFKASGNLKNWIYTIAKRQLSNFLKKEYQIHELPLLETIYDTPSWIDPNNQDQKIKKLETTLVKLKPIEQKVIKLRYLKNYTVKETAKALNLKPNNIKVIAHRSLKKLKSTQT